MMDRTDRHYRFFMRAITEHTLLYTQMITTGAVLHGDRESLLGYAPREKPLALQLGGDDPRALAECAKIGEDYGYDEVNLNVGCPSDRVQRGNFGACLMTRPSLVAGCVEAMRGAVAIPVTVKHRIGVDDIDRYEDMRRFVDVVAGAGCDRFSVHARKAWLQGLSPKQNRNVPPLRYPDVYRLKRERPDLVVEINGGITTVREVAEHLEQVDAVMIGRAAYDNPYLFATMDAEIFGVEGAPATRREVAEAMVPHADRWVAGGGKLTRVIRHIFHLYAGVPGARVWKRYLSENSHLPGRGGEVIVEALARAEDVQ
jgi:tRNA-dihydrouridine synthase A